MDVVNGSDCGVLSISIAYAFDICSGLNPCTVSTVRSGHTCLGFPVFLTKVP